ncbi:MAG: hypothetical protein ICV60_16085 [Pyrinomonadaceae bacterium]|nr:hypothetical protein [Pyrinomonadaceae bacterium]
MKHYNRNLRYITRAALLLVAVAISGAVFATPAQQAKKGTGPRDPFVPYKPVLRTKAQKVVAMPVTPPPIQARIDKYKAQKLEAMRAQMPAPKPTTALLLSEMQVIGIFRTPRGYAAMVEATPIKLSYTVYPGEQFYDGQLVAIEENRLVFRRETRYTDGKSQMNVEIKPLRQANAVSDSMAVTRSGDDKGAAPATNATAAAPSASPENK